MRNLPWKKIAIAALCISVVAAGVFYVTQSRSTHTSVSFVNPAFGEYIAAYTAGVVGSGSSIRVMLSQNVVDSLALGRTSQTLFEFKPALRGSTFWLDQRTVEFRPDSRMLSGQVYAVSFDLSKVQPVSKELAKFPFTFQVMPQNYEVSILNVKAHDNNVLTRQKIEGVVFTADYAAPDAGEKIMQASQEDKSLPVQWTHNADGRRHDFTVADVQRKDAAGTVSLVSDGSTLGIKRDDTHKIEIPALGDFKVVNVKVDLSASQHVVIQFSDPLTARQSLDGLIQLDDVGTLDFQVSDNEIRVFPSVRQRGKKTLVIHPGIRNVLDHKLTEGKSTEITFEQLDPAVRFLGKGAILPSTDGWILPFEAVNLRQVDIEVIKVYERNIVQFLQVNDLAGNAELRRVGRPVLKKTISLETSGVTDLGMWNRFTLDLAQLIRTEPGAIYQVRVGFRRTYMAYGCDGEPAPLGDYAQTNEWDVPEYDEASNWDSYEAYYYGDDYDWQQRDNPCHTSYYTGDRNIKKNLLASDLGVLAKRGGDGRTIVFVNDLKTTLPRAGVKLTIYDYQQQVVGSATTDGEGKAVVESSETPFVLVAADGEQRGYLKLSDGESLSISNFDVGGSRVDKGIKGFLYGERGVWRPGDSLYMMFVLEDRMKLLPPAHPVVFELRDPNGQVASRIVRSSGENGFYKFGTRTVADAPTGMWRAVVKVGGADFAQPVRIETVKPNRLKINLNFGVDKISANDPGLTGDLQVNWLHGAPGRNLRTTFEVLLTRATTNFKGYPGYSFDDPTRTFTSEAITVFDGRTDEEGRASVRVSLETTEAAPGMLNAIFRGKAFEESGNFSIDRFSIPYYPYSSFTGVRVPPGDKARGMLLTDTTHRVDVVTVDANGIPVSRENVVMSLHKLEWRWWWDGDAGDASYMSAEYAQPIASGTTRTVDGKGAWSFRISYPDWGRYLVRAYDPVSGHSTGKVVYVDWPGWAGRSRGDNEGATMLAFTADKESYAVGEKATLTIPGSDNGRALVSIENGTSVLETYWITTQKGDTPFSFEVKKSMTPNIYAHVTLVQPHAQTANDLPVRLYGIIPINVVDPDTKLSPKISMPDVLEPGKEVVINVSEEQNRKMTYTIAMVDEGLLDLTRFSTPDPWNHFFAREALGVRTWDVYDEVLGSVGARIDRLLAIGGDMEAASSKEDDTRANRFKPAIKFLGPFTSSGGSKEHRFIMPQYIGSVRTMVIAGSNGAYGKADKATPVRKPLMVLATLPRVLGPDEQVKLPVTIFTMDKSIRKVTVSIKASGPLKVAETSQDVAISGTDQTIDFDLSVSAALGVGKVQVIATSGSFRAEDEIEIDIRNPNPPVTKVDESLLTSGKNWSRAVVPVGMMGTNSAILEVSSMPPVNLGQRMKYLLQYPYGCIEQSVSSVFPQLYLSQIKALTEGEKITIERNIKAGIDRMKLFVTREGGFSYWPGGEDDESWASSYAGHFLIEAEMKGYVVPSDMVRRWKRYQRQKAQAWRTNQRTRSGDVIQAYRLYTLALAGEAELGAMNRLREQPGLSATGAWMLAAAYVKAGQPEAAKKMIEDLPTELKPYQELAFSYGSDLRDKAIVLETLVLLGDQTKGFEIAREISSSLGDAGYWMSTQTVAWCLKAMSAYAALDKKGELAFTYSYNGKEVDAKTDMSIAQIELSVDNVTNRTLSVTSKSSGSLFVRLIQSGTPARGAEEERESNLRLTVNYSDMQGMIIDPARLRQGTEFIATISVAHTGTRGAYNNLALRQVFPSGWEINNLRLDEAQERLVADVPDYQDIRDDRVYTYFDLGVNQRKTFKVLLTAGYAGSYYLPAVHCEAMYDHSIHATKPGRVVQVVKPEVQ
jgi:uncharacterized protein YfaS (alpha-2-macroglobulin family)